MTEPQSLAERATPRPSDPPSARIVRSRELFHEERELCIEHEGIYYRLRITRRNKLILQK